MYVHVAYVCGATCPAFQESHKIQCRMCNENALGAQTAAQTAEAVRGDRSYKKKNDRPRSRRAELAQRQDHGP